MKVTTHPGDVTLDVAPSALEESGPGGVEITLGLYDGPLTLQLARDEAAELIRWVAEAMGDGSR